jgi:transcriptional regulator with XRE-family HTH domain
MALVEKLIEEQDKLRLSDRKFAQLLGISSALWSNTKRGKAQPGRKLIAASVNRFPLLANSVVQHLSDIAR